MKRVFTKTNFNAGELHPELQGHVDFVNFKNGVKEALNWTIKPLGNIFHRNGTKFKAYAKTVTSTGNANPIKLIKFQFSATDGVLIEVGEPDSGNPYMRFYKNGSQVTEAADTITDITQASPAVVTTSSAHGYSTGDNVYITDVVGMTEVNRPNKPYQVGTVGSSTTFELLEIGGSNIDSTGYTAYSSGGESAKIYEISSPYEVENLDYITYDQSGNSLFIANKEYAPRELERLGDTDWSLNILDLSPEPTAEVGFTPSTTLTPAATSGTSVNFTAGASTFLQSDVGRRIINKATGETGEAVITSISSATVAVCDIITSFTDTNAIASGDWKLDLSPIAELEFSGTSSGSVISVTSNYPVGFKGPKIAISGINNDSPARVTLPSSHGIVAGDRVYISDVLGMTQINNRTLYVKSPASTTIDLTAEDGTGTNFNSIPFPSYSSGGTVQKVYTDIKADCFRSSDVGLYIKANDGILKIIEYVSATEVKCQVLKSLSSSDNTQGWSLRDSEWTASRGYPTCVGLSNGRLVFANTITKPTTIWFSELGIYTGFGTGTLDEDAISYDLATKKINQINWISHAENLVIGTSGSEVTIEAPSASSGLSATNIEAKTKTSYGSGIQVPVSINSETMFIQGSGTALRSFTYDFSRDKYDALDLNYFCNHLTESGIKEIDSSKNPNTKVYAVTNDGDLLVGIYEPKQQVLGWSKYTTNGVFENVQVVSNGTKDEVWVCVKRVINNVTHRYIELFDESTGESNIDAFTDSTLTYYNPKTVTGITQADPAVVTCTAHGFDDGDRVKLFSVEGMTEVIGKTYLVSNSTTNTFEITDVYGNDIDSTGYTAYTSGGVAHKLVQTISGLDHLEGETLSVKVDGAAHSDLTVSNGSITLLKWAYSVSAGFSYENRVTLLPLDIDYSGASQGQYTRYVTPIVKLYKSYLPKLNGTYRPSRSTSDKMDEKVPLYTGNVEYNNLKWSKDNTLEISIEGPFPCNILGIYGTSEGNIK